MNLDFSEGVIVTVISKSGPAYQSGVRAGDVLTKIDSMPIADVEEWLKLLWSYDVGSNVDIELFRNGEIINTTVQLGERES